MAKLPTNLTLNMLQSRWPSLIEPTLNSPLSTPILLTGVKLTAGSNTINHKLGQKLQGWIPVRFHGSWAQIYDTQDNNQQPQLTLLLNSSAAVTIDLLVF